MLFFVFPSNIPVGHCVSGTFPHSHQLLLWRCDAAAHTEVSGTCADLHIINKDMIWFMKQWVFILYLPLPWSVFLLPFCHRSPTTTHWFSWHTFPCAPAGTWSPATTWCWVSDVWWGRGTSILHQQPRFWLWPRPAAPLITAPHPSDS